MEALLGVPGTPRSDAGSGLPVKAGHDPARHRQPVARRIRVRLARTIFGVLPRAERGASPPTLEAWWSALG